MRLAGWSLHPVRLPYRAPVEWSDVAEVSADLLILRLRAEDGREGASEGTAKPTWSGATLASLATVLEGVVLPRLLNRDLSAPGAVLKALARVPENATAKAMADAAVRDLLEEEGPSGELPLSWTITLKDPAAMAREAEAMVAAHGFSALKLKGGRTFERDLETVRAVRAAVGPGVALTLDMNGLYADGPALRAHVASLAAAGLTHVEDPTTLRPDEAFRRIQSACAAPIMVDAAIWSEADGATFLERGARALGIKPGRVGPSVTEAIAARATAAGAEVAIGLFGESDLGAGATWRLAARMPPGWPPAETSTFLLFDRPLTKEPPALRGGRVALPSGRAAARADWATIARLHP
ncbi:hypothetical protein D9599_23755 [Roseomonas sp. KE2513]|uniref:enolase C-terminal domain-like protein n=1 Tax=Roseomonas sp. KE2513 TaxID=2479202 RepID=UPI0018E05575|nr:enolase C-terminal domain-like protein [Roseomonas sp. KE2513]MBI0538579.1 hypothetical protein [Roseomonas sp. KE2513]